MDYRVEMKYLCDMKDYVVLKSKINAIMKLDTNVVGDDYTVRSLYFDDYENSCFYANETGIDHREKFRIRTYNNNSKQVKLELKSKMKGFTHKETAALTKNEARNFINGTMVFDKEQAPLINKLYLKNQISLLSSSVIIEYTREPYIYEIGNVRVTFDRNIVASANVERFFEAQIEGVPVLETGQFILEVKYDEILPNEIYSILNNGKMRQSTFSKFYIGKMATNKSLLNTKGII